LDSHTGGNPFSMAEVGNQEYTLTTLTHTAAVTTITVASTALFTSRGYAIIGLEVFSYTGKTATTFTGVTRGADGTTAAAYGAGVLVGCAPVAANLNDHSAAIVAMQTQMGAGFAATGSFMRKIAELNGTGASGTIEFSSIPQIYRALQLHVCGRSDAAGAAGASIWATFESSPTAGAYNTQRTIFSATTSSLSEQLGTVDRVDCGAVPTAGSTANLYSGVIITIPEYRNTSMWKNVVTHSGSVTDLSSGGLSVRTNYGVWESTAAIDRIRLALSTGNWTTATRVTLWGLPA